MKEDKKKITTMGLARLFAIAAKQKSEGTYGIDEDTYIIVRSETMSVSIGDRVYLLCDEINIRVDEELREVIAHLRLREEHIGFCRFWL